MLREIAISPLQTLLSPDPATLEVRSVRLREAGIVVTLVATSPTRICSLCARPTDRVQSRYWRALADLPIHGVPVRLRLRAQRFFCRNRACRRRVFAERRWDEGCHNAMQLFRELRDRGFAGQRAIVADAVARLRPGPSVEDAARIEQILEAAPNRRASPSQVRWWFQGQPDDLEAETRDVLARFLADHAEARGVHDLTQRFARVIRERRRTDLDGRLEDARRGPRELQSFARGVQRDRAAVDAALCDWRVDDERGGFVESPSACAPALDGRLTAAQYGARAMGAAATLEAER